MSRTLPIYKCPKCGATTKRIEDSALKSIECHYCGERFTLTDERIVAYVLRVHVGSR